MTDLRIRPLVSFDEFQAGVELQKNTWGRHFDDVVSAALMRVSQKIGGVSAGAFDPDNSLVGIVFGLTGIRDDKRVHWSHMLAVETDWRGQGLGTALKIYQRRRVVPLGVDRMYWTFDPLQARNAHFNVNRLGVHIEGYVEDMYGSGETSMLHRGIGTDRLVALWPLKDAHVQQRIKRLEGTMRWDDSGTEAAMGISADVDVPAYATEFASNVIDEAVATASTGTKPITADSNRAFIEIPPDIQCLKISQPDEAVAWRTVTRAAFVHYFSHGMTVTGFVRDLESGRCFYVLDHASSA